MYQTSLGVPTAPASGATITLFDSSSTTYWDRVGLHMSTVASRLIFKLYSDKDSGASGVVIESASALTPASSDWVACPGFPVTFTATNGSQIYDILLVDRHYRIKYTNSANTIGFWDVALTLTNDRSAAA